MCPFFLPNFCLTVFFSRTLFDFNSRVTFYASIYDFLSDWNCAHSEIIFVAEIKLIESGNSFTACSVVVNVRHLLPKGPGIEIFPRFCTKNVFLALFGSGQLCVNLRYKGS